MCPDELKEQVKAIEVSRVDFCPIIRAYIQRLGLVELINSCWWRSKRAESGGAGSL